MASTTPQLTRLACEECRRRKGRCDRSQPQCGACAEAGTPCVVLDKRLQRGPKKGQLKALRTRIAILEHQLVEERQKDCSGAQVQSNSRPSFDIVEHSDSIDTNTSRSVCPESFLPYLNSQPGVPTNLNYDNLTSPTVPQLAQSSPLGSDLTVEDREMSDLVRADLDQLYFDRVHAVAPIIHKQQYFTWAAHEAPSEAHACLRSAMRTAAAAVSTQFRYLSGTLYGRTRVSLEHLDGPLYRSQWTSGKNKLQEIQAWLMLAHCELLLTNEEQAMVTAGRAFRLVQLARLHEIDCFPALQIDPNAPVASSGPVNEPPSSYSDAVFVGLEEQRRTFWLAYCWDRFLCTRKEWPLTFQENMIRTRLPASEIDLQGSHNAYTDFLSKYMIDFDHEPTSSFTECIVTATIHGRCMVHRRLAASDFSNDYAFWLHHSRLTTEVEAYMQILQRETSSATDPMATFARAMIKSVAVYLDMATMLKPWITISDRTIKASSTMRAWQAVSDLVKLTKCLNIVECLKAHPFLPDAVWHVADFLMTNTRYLDNSDIGDDRIDDLGELINFLGRIESFNCRARELLYDLQARKSLSCLLSVS